VTLGSQTRGTGAERGDDVCPDGVVDGGSGSAGGAGIAGGAGSAGGASGRGRDGGFSCFCFFVWTFSAGCSSLSSALRLQNNGHAYTTLLSIYVTGKSMPMVNIAGHHFVTRSGHTSSTELF